jgi:MFS family permease
VTSSDRSSRQPRLTLLLCLLVGIDAFSYAVLLPLLPFAAERSGASPLWIGALFASYSVGQLLAAPLLGAWSDRVGRRPILLLSQAGSAVGFALLLGPPSFGLLLASRTIDGLTAGNIAILYAAVLDHFPRHEWARRFAYLATATGAGILGGLLVSAAVAAHGIGLAASIGVALAGLSMLVTWLGLPTTQRARTVSPLVAWRATATDPAARPLRRTALAVLVATLAQTAFLLALPIFLARQLDVDEQGATLVIASLFAGAALFQVGVLPRLVQRIGEVRTALGGFGAVVAGGGGLSLSNGLGQILLGAGIVMLGVAALAATLPALLGGSNRVLDEGALMGLNQAVVSVGQMLGPVLGYAALTLPTSPAYGLLCALLGGAGLLALRRAHLAGGLDVGR